MPTLGEELRSRREKRGITLADISESTRIGTRFLKAIETDNYSILPGGIFTRSFIRAFAKQVGLNEDEAIVLYQQQVGAPVVAEQPAQAAPAERARRPEPVTFRQTPTRANWPTIGIAVGILFIFGIIIWALVNKFGSTTEATEPTTASSPSAQQGGAAPAASEPAQPAATQPPPEQASPNVATGEPILVKLNAITGSWVQYKVDDGKPVSKILKPGQVEELPPAQNQIKLSYGNRETLGLVVNNRQLSFPPDAPKEGHVIISRETLQNYFQ